MDFRQRALMEAWGSSEKDLLIQHWIAAQGGIYAPVSEEIQPNPHLSHIKDQAAATSSGRPLTLMNAAYVMRQLYASSREKGVVQGHFTSLDPIRAGNAPDPWESESLKAFESGKREVSSVEILDGRPYMRLMRPMIVEESCLKCHGHQGYKVGDVRGGFSVSVSMGRYLAAASTMMVPLSLGHGAIWVLGMGGILAATRNTRNHIRRINKEIAERKQAEQERERLLRTLEAKNEELQSVVYVASHDLKSPLVNIEGFSGELAKACKEMEAVLRNEDVGPETRGQLARLLDEDIPEAIRFIRAGTGKMQALLRGLLEVSRVGTAVLEIEVIDMNALMKHVIAGMQFQITDSGAAVTVEDLPRCLGDYDHINQVFSNLLANAIKYLDPARKGLIRVSGAVQGARVVYCVEDNGRGIAREHQAKIFEIFHRLEPEGAAKGDGLGLTIARRILDRQEGKIWVESESGKGSRFFVSLPAE
jgi:signal transduction histidine kinase